MLDSPGFGAAGHNEEEAPSLLLRWFVLFITIFSGGKAIVLHPLCI
jgi:hypothetical protein